jgi:adenine deaminase
MHIFLREGSVTRDIEALLPIVKALTMRRCLFCTDDREPVDLIREGHIDFCLRKAVSLGLDPVWAITMASLNAAEYFGLAFSGALAPGFMADLVVFQDLRDFQALKVMKRGRWVAEQGRPLWESQRLEDSGTRGTVRLPHLEAAQLRIPAEGAEMHVIELIPHQIVTGRSQAAPLVKDGLAVADPSRDLLKLAVVERHQATGRIGLAFVKGFGLREGAIASSVAHDSHNIVVAGVDDDDILAAIAALGAMQGGQVVVAQGKVQAALPLPIAGLMSDRELTEVALVNEELIAATRALGGTQDNPFMSLSFLALPVIPTLKLTDLGLVDVDLFQQIPLFVG